MTRIERAAGYAAVLATAYLLLAVLSGLWRKGIL